MPSQFTRYKKLLDVYLQTFLQQKKGKFKHVNQWSSDAFNKLLASISHGKTLRGAFVLFIQEAYKKQSTQNAVKIGAAAELIHNGFLIHDDIMDEDKIRRGLPSVYAEYEAAGKQSHIAKSLRFGQNMAICVGDMTFFLTMDCIADIKNQKIISQVLKACSIEYTAVCLAQMQDESFGAINRMPTMQEVSSLYTYKTARYTFSLPFILGGILTNISPEELRKLEKLGELMGLLFQLTDDMLNVYGNPKITGKPVGSDLREGKKTIALIYLFTHASNVDRQKLQSLIKQKSRSTQDIKTMYSLMIKYQVRSYIETEIQKLELQAKQQISELTISDMYKQKMLDVLNYIGARKK